MKRGRLYIFPSLQCFGPTRTNKVLLSSLQEEERIRFELRRAGMAVLEEQLEEHQQRRRLAEEQKRLVRGMPLQRRHSAYNRSRFTELRLSCCFRVSYLSLEVRQSCRLEKVLWATLSDKLLRRKRQPGNAAGLDKFAVCAPGCS